MSDIEYGVAQVASGSSRKAVWNEGDSFLRAVFESALLLLSIRFLEPVLFGSGFYTTLSFHPFWVVVLLASLQYGIFGGVTAACMASLLIEWPPRPIGVDITQHYIDLASLPLHWLLAALLLGSYRNIQLRELRWLRSEVDRQEVANDLLAEELSVMDSALAHAELALVTSEDAGTAALKALHELFECEGSREDVQRAFANAARSATNLPAALLFSEKTGFFIDRDPNSPLAFAPVPADAALVRKIQTERITVVAPMRDVFDDREGYLVSSGVLQPGSEDLIAIVAVVAHDRNVSEEITAVVDLLSVAVYAALQTPECRALYDNVTNIPTGTST